MFNSKFRFSEVLCWFLFNIVCAPSIDFLLIYPPEDSSGMCQSKLKHRFQALGVPRSDEKAGPDRFLCITLDSVEMKACLVVPQRHSFISRLLDAASSVPDLLTDARSCVVTMFVREELQSRAMMM